jgi:hypothetical protein
MPLRKSRKALSSIARVWRFSTCFGPPVPKAKQGFIDWPTDASGMRRQLSPAADKPPPEPYSVKCPDFVAKVVDEHSKWPPQRIFLMWRLSVCRFEAAILMLR